MKEAVAGMKEVDTQALEIAEMAGVKYRLLPLVVRAPERRTKTERLSAGAPVTITLSGVISDEKGQPGNIVLASTTRPTPGVALGQSTTLAVSHAGRVVFSVSEDAVERIERRSGKDRRS